MQSLSWSHLGLNQGPPDYESGATNQLSYRTKLASLGNGSAKICIIVDFYNIFKKNVCPVESILSELPVAVSMKCPSGGLFRVIMQIVYTL